MEFLSRQLPNSSTNNNSPVNLVIQSPKSEAAGYDASKTADFDTHTLPFRPDTEFHEYRFDWLPGQVSFYADNQLLRVMTEDIPNSPGHLVLNHWSNGDPAWSAGPPKEDAVFTITHAHLYFNSSSPAQKQRYRTNCPKPNPSQICRINDDTIKALIPLPPESTSGTTSSWVPNNATVVDPATKSKIVKKGSMGFIITGAVVGLFIVLFVVAMITVRHWASWRNRLKRTLGFKRVESPSGSVGPTPQDELMMSQRHTLELKQGTKI
jgi:hypothetical protein